MSQYQRKRKKHFAKWALKKKSKVSKVVSSSPKTPWMTRTSFGNSRQLIHQFIHPRICSFIFAFYTKKCFVVKKLLLEITRFWALDQSEKQQQRHHNTHMCVRVCVIGCACGHACECVSVPAWCANKLMCLHSAAWEFLSLSLSHSLAHSHMHCLTHTWLAHPPPCTHTHSHTLPPFAHIFHLILVHSLALIPQNLTRMFFLPSDSPTPTFNYPPTFF